LTSFGAAGFLQEGEEVRAMHCVDYYSFGGFFDLHYTSFFDFGDKWIDASAQRWCYLFRAYFCHRPYC
jgi:hypothetical protein